MKIPKGGEYGAYRTPTRTEEKSQTRKLKVFLLNLCHSGLSDLIGLTIAAFKVWKLTMNSVINKAPTLAATKIHGEIFVRYA
jgi:hypothetical protein